MAYAIVYQLPTEQNAQYSAHKKPSIICTPMWLHLELLAVLSIEPVVNHHRHEAINSLHNIRELSFNGPSD